MNWTDSFIKALNYIESHLLEDITLEDISEAAYISPFYFQKAFSIYTGYSLSEYIKSRRLYLAALDLKSTNESILDISLKYGYLTQESFTKAFQRFHDCTPKEARNKECSIKVFLPLKISISIVGGNEMDYRVEKESNLKFIGVKKHIKEGQGYSECPKFWDEFSNKYWNSDLENKEIKEAIKKYTVGAYALCIDSSKDGFDYYIAGRFDDDSQIEGLEVIELKESLWAKFKCVGPLPGALQAINTKIYKEWLPNNDKYELNHPISIEFYTDGDLSAKDYVSEIWLPVKEK